MILRRARATDLPGVLALERSGFPPREQWSETSWRGELEGGDRIVLVAVEPGASDDPALPTADRLLGVITFLVGPDTADLMRVVVAPSARGRRVGRGLVQAGLHHLRTRGIGQVLLEVRHDNAPALALYRGCGFTTLHTRPAYYGPGADALVMSARVETTLPPLEGPAGPALEGKNA
ncbi:N-acetyltransferase [Raineyella sp. LH-20]|uniref:N-acetyltransferase n=1 Tax=Raineyella sp. LH-20 TaxID=3081204 RepID=UPI002952EEF3|nr:N-acetyltransferase [Raineyella sp. LH-20]WOP18920.1 N-acetyltransferase [Raineyella sp. LH-20]